MISRKADFENIGGQVDEKVEDYHAALVRLGQEFLDHAVVTTEVTKLRIEDDVSRVNTQLGELSIRSWCAILTVTRSAGDLATSGGVFPARAKIS